MLFCAHDAAVVQPVLAGQCNVIFLCHPAVGYFVD